MEIKTLNKIRANDLEDKNIKLILELYVKKVYFETDKSSFLLKTKTGDVIIPMDTKLLIKFDNIKQ